MGRRLVWLLAGSMLASLGCAIEGKTPNGTWMANLGSFWGGVSPDSAQLEVATLHLPPGDAFLERDAWLEVNEQALPMDERPNLQANGLRIGVTSGPLPTLLHDKLAAKDGSAVIRRITIKGGQDHFLTISNANRAIAFDVQQDGEANQVSFEDGLPGLSLHWSKDPMGQTVLRCEPRLRHGTPSRMPKPSSDLAGWIVTGERPEETYGRMAWEAPLGPSDTMVLGTWQERTTSFGHALLTETVGKEPMQCLVLLRVIRGTANPATPSDGMAGGGPAPLVVQSLAQHH